MEELERTKNDEISLPWNVDLEALLPEPELPVGVLKNLTCTYWEKYYVELIQASGERNVDLEVAIPKSEVPVEALTNLTNLLGRAFCWTDSREGFPAVC